MKAGADGSRGLILGGQDPRAEPLEQVDVDAAIASSIAYVTSLVATLYWYRKVSGASVWEALIVRPSDRHYYGDLWQRLRGRALPAEKKAT